MAIFTPSESPAIVVKEIDLTGVVPNVQSTTGAIVGNFRWGPVEQPVLIDNEATLAATFGSPSDSNAVDFLSAAYFLKYSGSLQTIRMVDEDSAGAGGAANARFPRRFATQAPLVKNKENFDATINPLTNLGNIFIAKYPGALGSTLSVAVCPAAGSAVDSSGNVTFTDSSFSTWTYKSSFDGAPRTSAFASGVGASADEMHVVVIDQDGLISGTRGTVLETYPFVSLASNAKTYDGTSNFVADVVNSRSNYIWWAGFGNDSDDLYFNEVAGTPATNTKTYWDETFDAAKLMALDSGRNGSSLVEANFIDGFATVADKDTIAVDFLIAPGMSSRTAQTTVVNNLVTVAQSTRKDCVVVTSPARSDIVNNTTNPTTQAIATADTFTNSSYLITDNNYLKVYDKYNDKYRLIPAASSTAGIMAASDLNSAPWFSPAGARRGQYLGITALSYTPTKSQRDELYKAGVNPIANIPGQGVLLFGDKTKLNRPSAFDRINVRRLFLVVERAIALAARNTLFEFNDEFTRAEFVNIVEPFLREIKGRRGITDFRVVCDETNNTPAVIDRNEFIASIFIKPARSINYVTLNFVAVRTGVDFDEVVGTV